MQMLITDLNGFVQLYYRVCRLTSEHRSIKVLEPFEAGMSLCRNSYVLSPNDLFFSSVLSYNIETQDASSLREVIASTGKRYT